MNEEELFKARLAVEERPLKRLYTRYLKYVETLKTQPLSEGIIARDALLEEVGLFSISFKKFQLINAQNKREVQRYLQEHSKIQAESEAAQLEIQDLKTKLEEAKEIRKNKAEYDSIAKVINKLPTREECQRNLEQLQLEIESLGAESVKQELNREIRKKQVEALVSTAYALRDTINDAKAQAAKDIEQEGAIFDEKDDHQISNEEEGGKAEMKSDAVMDLS